MSHFDGLVRTSLTGHGISMANLICPQSPFHVVVENTIKSGIKSENREPKTPLLRRLFCFLVWTHEGRECHCVGDYKLAFARNHKILAHNHSIFHASEMSFQRNGAIDFDFGFVFTITTKFESR